MKKIFMIIALSAIVMLLLAAPKPSRDGRARVADEGEVPAGMYIKAATPFLPGDAVIITNLAKELDTEVKVMVFGNFSTSEGIVAILSPDVAEKLYITNDFNSVRITKTDANEEPMIIDDILDSMTETSTEVPLDNFDDDSEPYVEEKQPEIVAIDETPVQLEELATAIDETVPIELLTEEIEVTMASDDLEDSAPVLPEDEDIADEEVFTPFANMEEMPEEEVAEVAPIVEDLVEEPLIEPMLEEEVAVVAPTKEESITDEVPNVLIPTQNHPPELVVEDGQEVERIPDFFIYEEPQVSLVPQEEIILTETVENDFQAAEPLAILPTIEESDTNIEEYIHKYEIDSIQLFGKGNFCIQLGTYTNMVNIEKVISEYANKYPMGLIKSEKIPGAYQVFVGPLNKDEYTVVLKLFESRGFKDAFLRPIN